MYGRLRRTGTQVFDVHQDAPLAGKGIQISHRENPRMSLFESLHREGVRRKRRASRLLIGAWAIFFATSVFLPGCIASSAAAQTGEPGRSIVTVSASDIADAEPTPHAGCCQEVRAASLDFDVWAGPSTEKSGSKPPAVLRLAIVAFPAAPTDAMAGTSSRISPVSPVPTYLLTLRLRA